MPGWGKRRGGGGIIYCVLLVFILSCSSIINLHTRTLFAARSSVGLGWSVGIFMAFILLFLRAYRIIREES